MCTMRYTAVVFAAIVAASCASASPRAVVHAITANNTVACRVGSFLPSADCRENKNPPCSISYVAGRETLCFAKRSKAN